MCDVCPFSTGMTWLGVWPGACPVPGRVCAMASLLQPHLCQNSPRGEPYIEINKKKTGSENLRDLFKVRQKTETKQCSSIHAPSCQFQNYCWWPLDGLMGSTIRMTLSTEKQSSLRGIRLWLHSPQSLAGGSRCWLMCLNLALGLCESE